ncbi:MAG: hypothetical protein EXR76_03675 [Myxococcales bacterium]|nr:hypothetical protein [Myxococcales bacterium]
MSCSDSDRGRVDRAVTEGLESGEWRALRGHLSACAACASEYEDASLAVSQLEGHAFEPTDSAREALLYDLLSALEGKAAHASLLHGTDVTAPTSLWRSAALVASLGVVLVGVGAVLVGPGLGRSDDPVSESGLTARGATEASAGFSVFCLRPEDGSATVIDAAESGGGRAAACRQHDRLQFTYSVDARLTHIGSLALVALGPDGERAWYWPRPDETLPVSSGARQVALPGSFELLDRHQPGRWTILGIFAPASLSRAEVEAHLSGPELSDDHPESWLTTRAVVIVSDDVVGGHE